MRNDDVLTFGYKNKKKTQFRSGLESPMVPRRKKQLTICTYLNCIQWTFPTNRSHWERTLLILPLLMCLLISYDDFSFIFSSHFLGQRSKFCKHKLYLFQSSILQSSSILKQFFFRYQDKTNRSICFHCRSLFFKFVAMIYVTNINSFCSCSIWKLNIYFNRCWYDIIDCLNSLNISTCGVTAVAWFIVFARYSTLNVGWVSLNSNTWLSYHNFHNFSNKTYNILMAISDQQQKKHGQSLSHCKEEIKKSG